jgi:hypothetical protein
MLGIGKAIKIGSHLSHQHGQDMSAHPIDLFAARDLLFKGVHVAFDLLFQMGNRTILHGNQGPQLSSPETMVCSHFSSQRCSDLFLTRMHTRMHPLG